MQRGGRHVAWIRRGDIDGFFGLAVDNLVQVLLIDTLCRFVLGFSSELLYGQIMPAVALSLAFGNIYYARAAAKLAKKTGRTDVCALPYGINTVSLFGYVFLVMLPAKLAAERAGAADPSLVAFRAGLLACFGSGVIELAGASVAEKIRKVTPRAALLSTLAGIALSFISLGFLFRTFAHPLIGLSTFGVVLLVYFGKVTFRGGLPGGLVAVLLGLLIAWCTGVAPTGPWPQDQLGLSMPVPVVGELLRAVTEPQALPAVSIIIPMGLFNVVGSLQNIESAEAAGDSFETRPSLAINGLGTLLAAFFGSCFPTTIYIGHPAWKEMGARTGYCLLNATFFVGLLCSHALGYIAWAVPIDAGMAIVLWIGIVITAQAFASTPRAHAPAVVLGLLPGVGAWGTMMAKNGVRAMEAGEQAFSQDLVRGFARSDTWIEGAFALEQGFIFTAMILAATAVCLIERKFQSAAAWCSVAALLSAVGLMHSFQYTGADTVLHLAFGWKWAGGYLSMALLFFLVPWLTRRPSQKDNGE